MRSSQPSGCTDHVATTPKILSPKSQNKPLRSEPYKKSLKARELKSPNMSASFRLKGFRALEPEASTPTPNQGFGPKSPSSNQSRNLWQSLSATDWISIHIRIHHVFIHRFRHQRLSFQVLSIVPSIVGFIIFRHGHSSHHFFIISGLTVYV